MTLRQILVVRSDADKIRREYRARMMTLEQRASSARMKQQLTDAYRAKGTPLPKMDF